MFKRRWFGGLNQDDKLVLSICLENHKFRMANNEVEIFKTIQKKTSFDNKKIWRIKKKLIKHGLIDNNYLIVEKNIHKLEEITKEDENLKKSLDPFLVIIITIITVVIIGFIAAGILMPGVINRSPEYFIINETGHCVKISERVVTPINKTIYDDDKCSKIYEPVFYPNLSIKR